MNGRKMVEQPGVFKHRRRISLFPNLQHGLIGGVLWGGLNSKTQRFHGTPSATADKEIDRFAIYYKR